MKNKNRVGLFFALAALSLSMLNLGLIISKNHYKPQVAKLEQQVEELKNKNPVIIYQVDNAGGELIGTVTEKAVVDGHYTVTIGAYGKFLVTKEQYDSLDIGDDVPKFLKQRGIK
jgi:phage protein